MATRFYLGLTATPPVSPSFAAGWEQTGSAIRRKLFRKTTVSAAEGAAASDITNAITTTQDYLHAQFVSDPIPAQYITGTFSLALKCREANAGVNATLAVVLTVVSQDGSTVRGTLFSNFSQDTEFPLTASEAVRIVNAQAVTALASQPGDRLCLELGWNVNAPSVSSTAGMRIGFSGNTDVPLTSGDTSANNPWCELSQNIWSSDSNNYQFVKAGDGMSVTEKIR